jgi:hypothetical protein
VPSRNADLNSQQKYAYSNNFFLPGLCSLSRQSPQISKKKYYLQAA